MPPRSAAGKASAADPELPITSAITRLRDGYNTANVELVLSVFADGFTDMTDGEPSFYGATARERLQQRLESLFERYRVTMVPTIAHISFAGETAYDWGWHEFTLEPRSGGPAVVRRFRYLEHWQRDATAQWRIRLFMSNADRPPRM
jgi:ketosteroid isomerase-like protein